MSTERLITFGLLGLAAVTLMPACTPLALQPTASTGLVVYTRGASQHTASVQLSSPPKVVYAGMLAVISGFPEAKLVNQDESRFFIEVVEGERRVSAQATDLGRGETLLFVWADAGKSGQSGRDLALDAVELLCSELKVECTVEDF